MPKRPRSHELEDLSRVQLRSLFSKQGWVVWDLHPDYGEDLFVRIFSRNAATPYSFFIQAKATDHIEKYIQKDGKHIRFPIKMDHIQHWGNFWEPVILTILDAKTNKTYWTIIQDFLENEIPEDKGGNFKVLIPLSNVLDNKGLQKIKERTIKRFNRFQLLSEGMEALVDALEEQFNIEIEYEAEKKVWILKQADGSWNVFLLGELRDVIREGAEKIGIDANELFNKIIEQGIAIDYFRRGEAHKEILPNGEIMIIVEKEGYSPLEVKFSQEEFTEEFTRSQQNEV